MLILTRSEVIDVRQLVTVAEITAHVRGLATEVTFDHDEAGLTHPSAINCDGLHTISQTTLTRRVGNVDDITMTSVCRAVSYAIGC